LAYVVAAVTAAVIATIEQYNRLGARGTLQNQAWVRWLARTGLEAALGVAAMAIVREADEAWADDFLEWVAIGGGASAIARLRVLDYGKGTPLARLASPACTSR
jgi:hypothetical protein